MGEKNCREKSLRGCFAACFQATSSLEDHPFTCSFSRPSLSSFCRAQTTPPPPLQTKFFLPLLHKPPPSPHRNRLRLEFSFPKVRPFGHIWSKPAVSFHPHRLHNFRTPVAQEVFTMTPTCPLRMRCGHQIDCFETGHSRDENILTMLQRTAKWVQHEPPPSCELAAHPYSPC